LFLFDMPVSKTCILFLNNGVVAMKRAVSLLLLIVVIASVLPRPAEATDPADDPKRVEFFEKLYKQEITGVKPLEDYDDPDQFYAAIAQQVGIPQLAFEALEKRFGWKQSDEFFMAAIVKGGWDAPYWGVMVSRFPTALKQAKTVEERKALLKKMESKFVVIDYDGKASFPQEDKSKDNENTPGEATQKQDRP
jgi:hypothetical protein